MTRIGRLLLAIVAVLVGVGTTAANATAFVYDGPVIALVGIHAIECAEAGLTQLGVAHEESVSPSTEVLAASTTPHDAVNATEAASGSNISANKAAGDAFRDQVAGRLPEEGFNVVDLEVSARTPFGSRRMDILAERNGSLVNVETKLGSSRYLPIQRAKDVWMSRVGVDLYGTGDLVKIPTMVIRGPF